MKLTIGMASYNNPEQVWWTVQALRLYHDLTDCEIVIIDNAGNNALKNWVSKVPSEANIKYVCFTEKRGTAIAKQQVFNNASGDFVLCIDSHVMLAPGSIENLKKWIDKNRDNADLLQGPMLYDDLGLCGCIDSMKEVWSGGMLGVWNDTRKELPSEPYEIAMHGMGLFGCFKNKWLGFNDQFIGFGGEEGYIHRKYRKAGKKVLCLPFMKWAHRFHDQITATNYPNTMEERIRNYVIGWDENGDDIQEIKDNFKNFEIEFVKSPTGNSLSIKHK